MYNKTKVIFEAWRKFLNESTINRIYTSIQTLYFHKNRHDKNSNILINDAGKSISFYYYLIEGIEGEIHCDHMSYIEEKYTARADGREIWQISFSEASETWGPLLYEICLEYISTHKNGALMSDRMQVSPFAESVWEKYMNRSMQEENIVAVQMDFSSYKKKKSSYPLVTKKGKDFYLSHNNEKTPIKKYTPEDGTDDITQVSTFNNLLKKGVSIDDVAGNDIKEGEWINSPLSKAYYKKESDVIDKLKSLNLILISRSY